MGGLIEQQAGHGPTEGEVRSELEKVLQSPTFQRSERLQRFLQFVCEETLRGEGSKINEYLIGAEVFKRGAGYSPNEDGVVRRQAHALRRKLQEYYETDGRGNPLRIDLPLGRYVPVFRRAGGFSATMREKGGRRQWVTAGAILIGILLFIAGWFAAKLGAPVPSQAHAATREIWGPWLNDPAGATICFSNPLSAVIKHFHTPQPPGSHPPRLPLSPEQDRFFRSVVSLPPGGYLYFAPAISQSKMGEAVGAIPIAALFAGAGRPIRTTQSRFLTWEDLTRENLILLGHNEANAWLDRVLEKYPYQLRATEGERQRSIVNTQVETEKYQILYADEEVTGTQEYALISMIPGVDGRHRLLLINGLNTQATQVAAEYITSPSTLDELHAELKKRAPGHQGPWRFQAVLRTEVHDKVPTKVTLMAAKVLPNR